MSPINFFTLAVILVNFAIAPVWSQSIANQELEILSPANLNEIKQIGMFHRGTIEEMSWSPDGTLIAVGGSAGGWIYDATDLNAEPIHFAQFMRVHDVDFHPDGTKIISTGYAGSIFEWDTKTGQLLREIMPSKFNDCTSCASPVVSVKYSSDGNFIVAGAMPGWTLFLNAISTEVTSSIPYSTDELAFSLDGRYIVAKDAIVPNTIHIWSVESLRNGEPEPEQTYSEFQFTIRDLAWTAGSKSILVAGDGEGNIYEYDVTTQSTTVIAKGSETVATNRDTIVSKTTEYADSGYYVLISHVKIASLDKTLPTKQFDVTGRISDLQFSPDNHLLAIGTEKGGIEIWNIDQLILIDSVVGTGEMITAVDLLDNRYLVTLETEAYSVYRDGGACGDNILRLWDLSEGIEVNSWQASTAEFGHFICSAMIALPNSQQVVLQDIHKEDVTVIVLNPFTNEFFSLKMPFEKPHPYHRFVFKLSNDKSLLGIHAVGNSPDSDAFFVWDISRGLTTQSRALGIVVPDHSWLDDFEFAPDNKSLVISNHESEITIWDIKSGNQIGNVEWIAPKWFNTVELAISPDGSMLAINAAGIQLFDTSRFELLRAWNDEENGTGEDIIFGTSKDWFATHRHYTTYRFWSTNSDSIFQLPAKTNSIAFSPDNTFFVTGGEDGAIRIWGIPIHN